MLSSVATCPFILRLVLAIGQRGEDVVKTKLKKFIFHRIWHPSPFISGSHHVRNYPLSLSHPALLPVPSMASPAKRCPGCLKLFTSQRAHLAQAPSPLCRRLAKKRKSSCLGFITRTPQCGPLRQPDPQPLSTPHDSPPIPTNETPPPREQDVPRSPSQELPTTPSNEDESDDEDEDLDGTFESSSLGWEPPVLNDADNMSVSSDNTDPDIPPSPPPEGLRERAWVAPKVVGFPSPLAGEAVRSADSTNSTYAARLGKGSDSNPYSPFTSKIDWEVAKWAKLQGPSSTSFAELLKIEGVISFHRDS